MKNQEAKNSQLHEVIIETIKTEKPETTEKLIKLLHKKTKLSTEQITNTLIELEKQDKIHFTKKEIPPTSATQFLVSSKSTWYWITITLAIVTTLAVFTIPKNTHPLFYARSALGIVFVLFLPGYAFVKALFPTEVPIKTSSENLDAIERIVLSIGMSIALVPLVGLILNYTPWGIRLTPITLSLLVLTVIFATIAVVRENQQK